MRFTPCAKRPSTKSFMSATYMRTVISIEEFAEEEKVKEKKNKTK
jgi:hypothetical protein